MAFIAACKSEKCPLAQPAACLRQCLKARITSNYYESTNGCTNQNSVNVFWNRDRNSSNVRMLSHEQRIFLIQFTEEEAPKNQRCDSPQWEKPSRSRPSWSELWEFRLLRLSEFQWWAARALISLQLEDHCSIPNLGAVSQSLHNCEILDSEIIDSCTFCFLRIEVENR